MTVSTGILLALALPLSAAEIVEVRKIWDQAPHNAFTDLARIRGQWYCVFREGQRHADPAGALRVIVSRDGRIWSSAALLQEKGDLRDAKITQAPDGRLMLNGAIYPAQPGPVRLRSLAWFSRNGREWTAPVAVGDPEFWLWRVTWHKGMAYTGGYHTNPDRNQRTLRFYRSRDGRSYQTFIQNAGIRNSPGENTIRFLRDGSALCLLRRDAYKGPPPIPESAATALVGAARPPYTDWTWKDTGVRIGGPNFIEVPGGRFAAAVRLMDGEVRTSLCWLDPEAGSLQEFLRLPSGGDTSYAGLVWHGGLLWVSYYSSHQGKSSIYLARVRLP